MMGMKDWESVRKALGIKEEQRTVYAVGRRAWMTKDAAIREGLKALAARLDGECECSKGDSVTPDYYCGCHERREQMISRMTPIVKAMPASKAKWDRMILMYQEAKQPKTWVPRVRQADVWNLTPDELALYLRIAYHARPPRWLCVASTKTLCDSGLSDTKVRAAKKTLQAKKRIKITRRLNQTDQITIVNPVIDRSDVYVPHDVVTGLRPSELAIYCRIADRDRGTGCKAQNKELATKICSVRQVANILAKLESDGLIRRYFVEGKRFLSSKAYEFKAHAAHLAELEKQTSEACNLGEPETQAAQNEVQL